MKNESYDFWYGNDARFIKVAIKNDFFHTMKIQAEAALTIDLSGGTGKVQEISLSKCFKITRINWPPYTGHIKRLKISWAENLERLDLSLLPNLEELSIVDCHELSDIVGLGPALKHLNIHRAKIKRVDVSHSPDLEVVNIISIASMFEITLEHLSKLKMVALQIPPAEVEKNAELICTIDDAPKLQMLAIITALPLMLTVSHCSALRDAKLEVTSQSRMTGLDGVSILGLDQSERLMEIDSAINEFKDSVLNFKLGPEDTESVVQQFGTLKERNRACLLMVNLLSAPEEHHGSRKKNVISHLRKVNLTELQSLLRLPDRIVYTTTLPSKLKQFPLFSASRIFNNEETDFLDWQENVDQRNPNILLLSEVEAQRFLTEELLHSLQTDATISPTSKIVVIRMPAKSSGLFAKPTYSAESGKQEILPKKETLTKQEDHVTPTSVVAATQVFTFSDLPQLISVIFPVLKQEISYQGDDNNSVKMPSYQQFKHLTQRFATAANVAAHPPARTIKRSIESATPLRKHNIYSPKHPVPPHPLSAAPTLDDYSGGKKMRRITLPYQVDLDLPAPSISPETTGKHPISGEISTGPQLIFDPDFVPQPVPIEHNKSSVSSLIAESEFELEKDVKKIIPPGLEQSELSLIQENDTSYALAPIQNIKDTDSELTLQQASSSFSTSVEPSIVVGLSVQDKPEASKCTFAQVIAPTLVPKIGMQPEKKVPETSLINVSGTSSALFNIEYSATIQPEHSTNQAMLAQAPQLIQLPSEPAPALLPISITLHTGAPTYAIAVPEINSVSHDLLKAAQELNHAMQDLVAVTQSVSSTLATAPLAQKKLIDIDSALSVAEHKTAEEERKIALLKAATELKDALGDLYQSCLPLDTERQRLTKSSIYSPSKETTDPIEAPTSPSSAAKKPHERE